MPGSLSPRSIGIFDSGLGGLTVARAVRDAFPDETICYLGDTARVPYGTKSPETVKRYARENIAFLLQRGVKVVVAACNTVSAAALPDLVNDYPVPVLGVVEMGAAAALVGEPRIENEELGMENEESRMGPSAGDRSRGSDGDQRERPRPETRNEKIGKPRIGVIGTAATVASEAYVRAIRCRAPDAEVLQQACPLFVPLIEEGWMDHAVTRAVVAEYLNPMRETGIDTLILGCTHYPLIKPLLAEFFGPAVRLVDSAQAMVGALRAAFEAGAIPLSTSERGEGRTGSSVRSHYYVTDRGMHFRQLVEAFMGGEVAVEQIRSDELTAALESMSAGR